MDSKTSSDTTPTKKEVSETIGCALLANCAKNSDEANSKLAVKTLKQVNTVGFAAALEEMAKDCFKHPKTGQPLSYSEMRMFYG